MAYTTIDDGSEYFHTQLYTGNGSSGHSITNDANAGDFQPDWLWIKPRSASDNHVVFDSSRTSNKRLKVNSSDAEDSDGTAQVTFESNGFDLDTTDPNFNGNGTTYVAWQWKANGGTTSSNSSGSITSTVQANTTAGFSIVTYTGNGTAGATIGHGLGAVPHVIIVKNRSKGTDGDWNVFHHKNTSEPETDFLVLNNTDATSDASNRWNDTTPTSSVFTVGSTLRVNEDGDNYIAYLFCEKQGYSKFASYKGNGSENGSYIYTGFKPAWILYKGSTLAENYIMNDTKRDPHNLTFHRLDAERNIAETTNTGSTNPIIDILSNGFKIRGSGNVNNGSGETYIYMAFAEHPFVSSGGVPVTARWLLVINVKTESAIVSKWNYQTTLLSQCQWET